MIKRLLRTENGFAELILRVMLGIVMYPHGMQKLFGWFGGYGFSGTMGFFTESLHVPAALAFLAIMAEAAGSLGLITGLFTRVAALGITVNMAVAIFMVHLPFGFFMNWAGTQKGEGYEYHMLAIAIGLALVIRGGGMFSADRAIASRLR